MSVFDPLGEFLHVYQLLMDELSGLRVGQIARGGEFLKVPDPDCNCCTKKKPYEKSSGES
jgi:hypothetical protein